MVANRVRALVQDGGQLDIGEEIGTVVGGHAIGAQGHVDSRPHHGRDRGHPGAQLQVGPGVVDTGDPLLRHESPVLLRGVDAVGRQ